MQFKTHSFRYGEELFSYEPEFVHLWQEIKGVLDSITEDDLIQHYNNNPRVSKKSISDSINDLIDHRLIEKKWERQSPIFNNSEYRPTSRNRWWTLDKTCISR